MQRVFKVHREIGNARNGKRFEHGVLRNAYWCVKSSGFYKGYFVFNGKRVEERVWMRIRWETTGALEAVGYGDNEFGQYMVYGDVLVSKQSPEEKGTAEDESNLAVISFNRFYL